MLANETSRSWKHVSRSWEVGVEFSCDPLFFARAAARALSNKQAAGKLSQKPIQDDRASRDASAPPLG